MDPDIYFRGAHLATIYLIVIIKFIIFSLTYFIGMIKY
jgi:hypothetical protein